MLAADDAKIKDFADVIRLSDEDRARAVQTIGRPRALTVRATLETVALMDKWRAELASVLMGADTTRKAESLIRDWAARMADDDTIADALYRANLQTNLAGQLFVREIEVPKVTRKLASPPRVEGFVNLPFEEAIASFRSRARVSPDVFAELSDSERFRSFTMTRVASEQIRENAFSLLSKAMQPDGVGMREFIASIANDEAALGFTPNSHGYLENVYRTGTAVSYNAGRYTAQKDPLVVAGTGYWQYLTVEDDRVRSEHAALHGKTWKIGDPEAERVYPPNGFQCRCAMVVLDPEDVDQRDLERSVPADEAITTGFSGNPVGAIRDEA